MKNIIIDQEFKSFLPSLDRYTYEALEANILEYGCRDSLVLWGDILIDGHNRYEICMKHNIPFDTVNVAFDSREDVLIWIISTQIARRNLTPLQLSHFRGVHYRADKKIKGSYMRRTGDAFTGKNDIFQSSTASRLSAQYHVSPKTIKRDAKIADAIDAIGEVSIAAKQMILTGEINIDKNVLAELLYAPREEIEALAADIENGKYDKKAVAEAMAVNHASGSGVSAVKEDDGDLSGDSGNGNDDGNGNAIGKIQDSVPGGGHDIIDAGGFPFEADDGSLEPFDDEMPLSRVFYIVTDESNFQDLRRYSANNDKPEFRAALWSYIDMLELLYKRI